MELVEIRDLDGPNIFLLEPAIKVEFKTVTSTGNPSDKLRSALCQLHEAHGLACPASTWVELETPSHVAFAFGWSRRRFAFGVAKLLARLAQGENVDLATAAQELAELLESRASDDLPLMVRDKNRSMPIVSITGTNGKTTTTRLVTHILRSTGRKVGWSSSAGVYIEGELVMEGDYTGPAGAVRVLSEPGLDAAVLETARGGILLRGVAYESNDVSIFTNVSGDHLDLQGIHSVEGLADAKSVVIRITKPDGVAVLNVDDPLVAARAPLTNAKVCFVSQVPGNQIAKKHIKSGGIAVVADDRSVNYWRNGVKTQIADIDLIPIAFGGSAKHMIENALCATAATLAMGLSPAQVRDGLLSFSSTSADNLGRLNIYEVEGTTVIVDFAHNEAGLRHLLSLATGLKQSSTTLTTIIGTAGDRTDANLFELGRIAAESSDAVIIKETAKYLRGRASNDELNKHYIAGIKAGGMSSWSIEKSEVDALKTGLERAKPGDIIAMMCVEQVAAISDFLRKVGSPSPLGQPAR